MTKQKIIGLALCNVLGIALFLSWDLPPLHGFWYVPDCDIFFLFNHWIATSEAFCYFVAFTNLRPFDAVAFLFMLGIFCYHYRRQDANGRRWMIAMGLTMVVAIIIEKQFDMAMNFHRPSPTKYFLDAGVPVVKVSELTGWPAKDYAGASFPGDHGMMLLIFTCFMLRYFGKKTFFACLAVFVAFSLPRMMSGAHWMTDVVEGAGSIACVVLSWMLLTPMSDWIIGWFMKHMPWGKLGRTFAANNHKN